MFSRELMPTLHTSSFNADTALREPPTRNTDKVIVGFREQTAAVSVGLNALLERAVVRAKLRAGKMIILAQSGFAPSEVAIAATSPGLRSAHVTVKTRAVGPNVDLPRNLPALQPTRRALRTKATPDTPVLVRREDANPAQTPVAR